MTMKSVPCHDLFYPGNPPWSIYVSYDPPVAGQAVVSIYTQFKRIPLTIRFHESGGTVYTQDDWAEHFVIIDSWTDEYSNALRLGRELKRYDAMSVAQGLSQVGDLIALLAADGKEKVWHGEKK